MADTGTKEYIAKEKTSQDILGRVGSAGDSGSTTVFGKLNNLNAIESALDYTVTGITASGTLVQLSGKGRIYQMAVSISNVGSSTHNLQIIVDQQILYNIQLVSTGNAKMAIMTTKQSVMLAGSDMAYACNSIDSMRMHTMQGYITQNTTTLTGQSYTNCAWMIYLPEYIAFQESFEIKMTLGATPSTNSGSYSMIGYKMM